MQTTRIAIVGAGLSGLYAAFLLEQKGITDYVLLEAREDIGGRVTSATMPTTPTNPSQAAEGSERFDLGATWFWPGYQPQLDKLICDLGLTRFEQYETGDMVVERSPNEAPIRTRGDGSSPPSMRLHGGMSALTNALCQRLATSKIVTRQTVRRLRTVGNAVELDSEDRAGGIVTWRVEHVLLAMPPRLVENSIEFSPPLPTALAQQWRGTATWMAPHAKYVAVFDSAFWRAQGLSGEARSARGPLAEIHDASAAEGGALFGFLGVPARVRTTLSDEVLRAHCRTQLVRLFGPQALAPRAEFLKDWALDSYTATAADLDSNTHHAGARAAVALNGPWAARLTGIASEWSPQYPGYLAGAIEAASVAVEALAA